MLFICILLTTYADAKIINLITFAEICGGYDAHSREHSPAESTKSVATEATLLHDGVIGANGVTRGVFNY